ncbi:hypothetical protein BH11PSE3_BH11PSE3_37400 [soil metagenome]
MPPLFDPAATRRHWLTFELDVDDGYRPQSGHPRMWASDAQFHVTLYAEAYMVGLADRVRPRIESLMAWMESQPEPDPRDFPDPTWSSWQYVTYQWRQTLGLCKWLSRGDRAETLFCSAVDAAWQDWERSVPTPKQAEFARKDLRLGLDERLATALAGNVPALGVKFYETSGLKWPSGRYGPPRGFGDWACRHLAAGGVRDADFVTRGAAMLAKALPARSAWCGSPTASVLWLKVIYFDSGVVRTPEQAIFKAYDALPDVARPDFLAE